MQEPEKDLGLDVDPWTRFRYQVPRPTLNVSYV
jgi:hypothetical protein